jgi:hypothetical protein
MAAKRPGDSSSDNLSAGSRYAHHPPTIWRYAVVATRQHSA